MDDERLEQLFISVFDRLDVVHTLVNSNMTAAMQAELDATVREAALMQEVIDDRRTRGIEPSKGALVAVERADERVAELTASLRDRLKAGVVAEKQVAKAEAHDAAIKE